MKKNSIKNALKMLWMKKKNSIKKALERRKESAVKKYAVNSPPTNYVV
jgi:hypothetical protein